MANVSKRSSVCSQHPYAADSIIAPSPTRHTFLVRAALIALAALLPQSSAAPVGAAPAATAAAPASMRIRNYVGEHVMIPMRDGVRLHAQIWRPEGSTEKLPILIERWPYGYPLESVQQAFKTQFKELAEEGFIFVLQDIRGRFGSEGEYVMLRPRANRAGAVDESTDSYDTIDWLVRMVSRNNGNVGIFGVSYGGWTAAMATINPHPALKAVSVQGAPEDIFLGDDFHHNGAFRLDYAWEFAAALETDGRTLQQFDFGANDSYAWFLKQGPIAELDKVHLGRTLPTWRNFVEHPNYDSYWRAGLTSAQLPAKVAVPNLNVGGWWDQEDFYGPQEIYAKQERRDHQGRNFLVIGPWNHGGWAFQDGRRFGPLDLGSETSVYYRTEVQKPWFNYWLKGKGKLEQPEALIFQTGSNVWKRYRQWPPREGVTRRNLYLHQGGKLSFEAPSGDRTPARFVSDPANPVPYRERPIEPVWPKVLTSAPWREWLADDQAPFAKRTDVLSWQSEPLKEDITVTGDIVATLYASTTGSDADWVVKLIDVYPEDAAAPALRGRQMMVANEVFRGRYRTSFEKPEPITPGAVLDYKIDMHTASHVFRKGHRIAVQIQSSWFPLIDRNPQIFVDTIYKADPKIFRAQTHSIYQDSSRPSAISLAVAEPGMTGSQQLEITAVRLH